MCQGCRTEPIDYTKKPVEVAHLGLHAHQCTDCRHFFSCYQDPCRLRGTDLGDQWTCGCVALRLDLEHPLVAA
jgi:hypothetical protein